MKVVFDLLISILALIILSPLLLILVLLAFFIIKRPIFFRQLRPGLHGKPFEIIKFRTMLILYDDEGNLLPDERRTTRFGEFLRSTSLDELPELLNVIKGEMSLVGPRPLMMEYLPRYNKEQARRHDVKPGITGLAQIGGRNAISWDEKFALDLKYVDSQSFMLDVTTIAKTIYKVLKRDGISHPEHATMPEFMGSTTSHNNEKQ